MAVYAYTLPLVPHLQHLVLTEQELEQVETEWYQRIPFEGKATGDLNELFRIAERIRYELFNNGGGNDKNEEITFLHQQMKTGLIPKHLHDYIYTIVQFLENAANTIWTSDDTQLEIAMAYSCELTRFALSIL